MKRTLFILFIVLSSIPAANCQKKLEGIASYFTIEQNKDSIDFIIIDTLLDKKKPIFLWCQGSLPMPLFFEVGNKNIFFGGGVINFDFTKITKDYHLVVISMPKTPVLTKKENLNDSYQYVPDKSKPREFSKEYLEADYLENYTNRALAVLDFLKKQSWVSSTNLVVAGHSQGSKVATKISRQNKDVTHLGLFGANPFGRIDQFIRTARLDAQMGKTSWEEADSIMNDNYAYYQEINKKESLQSNPNLRSMKSFSETMYDDWLKLEIPIYLAYGTEDRTADLCDLMPIFFTNENKNNLTLKRYLKLEHNFFEVNNDGRINYEKALWPKVMDEFLEWVK